MPFSYPVITVRGCIQKFPDWPPGKRTANDTAICHRCSCIVILWVIFCHHNPLCCFSM